MEPPRVIVKPIARIAGSLAAFNSHFRTRLSCNGIEAKNFSRATGE
jgi:hypothetical protein